MDLDSVILSEVREGEILYGIPYMRNSKGSVCSAGDLGSTPGLGRSTGEGNGYPVQYSCLQNPHGQRQATVHGVVKSWTKTEGLTLLTLLKRNDANEFTYKTERDSVPLSRHTLQRGESTLSLHFLSYSLSWTHPIRLLPSPHQGNKHCQCHDLPFQREGIVPN